MYNLTKWYVHKKTRIWIIIWLVGLIMVNAYFYAAPNISISFLGKIVSSVVVSVIWIVICLLIANTTDPKIVVRSEKNRLLLLLNESNNIEAADQKFLCRPQGQKDYNRFVFINLDKNVESTQTVKLGNVDNKDTLEHVDITVKLKMIIKFNGLDSHEYWQLLCPYWKPNKKIVDKRDIPTLELLEYVHGAIETLKERCLNKQKFILSKNETTIASTINSWIMGEVKEMLSEMPCILHFQIFTIRPQDVKIDSYVIKEDKEL